MQIPLPAGSARLDLRHSSDIACRSWLARKRARVTVGHTHLKEGTRPELTDILRQLLYPLLRVGLFLRMFEDGDPARIVQPELWS